MIYKWGSFKPLQLGNPRWQPAAITKKHENMKMTIFKSLRMNSDVFRRILTQSYFSFYRLTIQNGNYLPKLKIAKMSNKQYQGPVVQRIISLTSSLRGQLVKCFTIL